MASALVDFTLGLFFLTERRVVCENIDGGHDPSMVPMF